MNKAAEQMLLSTNLADSLLGGGFEFRQSFGSIVGQGMTLQIAPTVFVGVQFGRVGREELGLQTPAAGQKRFHLFPPMSVEAIPNQKHLAPQVPQQIAQEGDHLLLANGAIRMEMEIPAQTASLRRDRQRTHQRDVSMMPRTGLQHGRLAAWRPGAVHERRQKYAGFINENYRALIAGGFFFNRGQVCSIHSPIAVSSRSRAWRSGFCTENPKDFISLGR